MTCRCEYGQCGMLLGAGCDCRCHVASEREALKSAIDTARAEVAALKVELKKRADAARKEADGIADMMADLGRADWMARLVGDALNEAVMQCDFMFAGSDHAKEPFLRKGRRVLSKFLAWKKEADEAARPFSAMWCRRCGGKGRSRDKETGKLVGCRACRSTGTRV